MEVHDHDIRFDFCGLYLKAHDRRTVLVFGLPVFSGFDIHYFALRVSDVSTLRKDAVSWDPEDHTWRVFLYTQKTGDPVFLPIPETAFTAIPRTAAS
jgi:hypothetical protein